MLAGGVQEPGIVLLGEALALSRAAFHAATAAPSRSALGTTAGDPDDCGHYATERAFGPVVYKALAISHKRQALHAAWASYSGSVSVDDDQVVAA